MMAETVPFVLGLRTGDLVEVRSKAEILATLDENGCLDALPFMPEMSEYCGRQFRVYKRADKACDTIVRDGIRSMPNTVLLDGLRCDGQAHGGCQAACTIFWKEAWLKPVQAGRSSEPARKDATKTTKVRSRCTEAMLQQACCKRNAEGEEVFSCQATELRKATTFLPWWDLRQYWNDVRTGNFKLRTVVTGLLTSLFNEVQIRRGGCVYPFVEGKNDGKTPREVLNLKPGEIVQVKTKDEILATLDKRQRNRGLSFDREQVRYCDGKYRVLGRVEKLVDEKNGKMIRIPNDCVVLDKVICSGELNRFCPRDLYHFWREIWLKRVD